MCWKLDSVPQTAELIVIDQLFNRRLVATHRAIGIAPQLQCIDLHRQGVKAQQPPDQTVTLAENDLDRFQRFDDADQPR